MSGITSISTSLLSAHFYLFLSCWLECCCSPFNLHHVDLDPHLNVDLNPDLDLDCYFCRSSHQPPNFKFYDVTQFDSKDGGPEWIATHSCLKKKKRNKEEKEREEEGEGEGVRGQLKPQVSMSFDEWDSHYWVVCCCYCSCTSWLSTLSCLTAVIHLVMSLLQIYVSDNSSLVKYSLFSVNFFRCCWCSRGIQYSVHCQCDSLRFSSMIYVSSPIIISYHFRAYTVRVHSILSGVDYFVWHVIPPLNITSHSILSFGFLLRCS